VNPGINICIWRGAFPAGGAFVSGAASGADTARQAIAKTPASQIQAKRFILFVSLIPPARLLPAKCHIGNGILLKQTSGWLKFVQQFNRLLQKISFDPDVT
jgi:hypothetical protein